MAGSGSYRRLLSPLRLKHLTLKNRIVKAPYSSTGADPNGYVLESAVAHYESVARGGVGLFITESVATDPLGVSGSPRMAMWDDSYVPGQRRLVEAVHRHGTPILMQVHHAGTAHSTGIYGAQEDQEVAPASPVGPSTLCREELPCSRTNLPRGLSVQEIGELVEKFTRTAEWAKEAGFDGVQLHFAFGYLVNSFFSPAWNRRADEYGGSLKNRARFGIEIMKNVRTRLGDDFVVGVRMNAVEYGTPHGMTLDDSRQIAAWLEQAGADFIHVSAYGYGQWEWPWFPEQVLFPETPKGGKKFARRVRRGEALLPGAESIKRAVSVPVIAGDGMTFESAERALRRGKADLISFGRPLIADPDFPNKLKEGREKDIRRCTRCMTCLDAFIRSQHERCRVNAAFGKEKEMQIAPATIKKRVMVVGGGPAGMEAARVAALRGHSVSLYEGQPKLGGMVPLASLVKGGRVENLPDFLKYLERQMKTLRVQVKLGEVVDANLPRRLRPDAIVVATGSKLTMPSIPGSNGRHVTTSAHLHKQVRLPMRVLGPSCLDWATKVWLPMGRRVMLIGGLMQGAELAEFLVKRGRQVVLTDPSEQLGTGMLEFHRAHLLRWLAEKGASLRTNVTYEQITKEGVIVAGPEGSKSTIQADTVVLVSVPEADHALYKEMRLLAPEVYEIGDCYSPGMIVDAVEAGSRVGITV